MRGGRQQRPVPTPPPAGPGPRRCPRHGGLNCTLVPLASESISSAALEFASLLQRNQSLALLGTESNPDQPVSLVNPVHSSMQTGTGGHDDARSNRYDPSTWREATSSGSGAGTASSARGYKASWHGKLSVVADTQRFLEQLQRRQQARPPPHDTSYLHTYGI